MPFPSPNRTLLVCTRSSTAPPPIHTQVPGFQWSLPRTDACAPPLLPPRLPPLLPPLLFPSQSIVPVHGFWFLIKHSPPPPNIHAHPPPHPQSPHRIAPHRTPHRTPDKTFSLQSGSDPLDAANSSTGLSPRAEVAGAPAPPPPAPPPSAPPPSAPPPSAHPPSNTLTPTPPSDQVPRSMRMV